MHNPLRERCADLDKLPFPDLTLIAGHTSASSNTPIMTSWGCPFACNFCSVTAMFGRKYRFRSAENVIAEIKEKRPKRIFFYDDNFAADKARLKTLLRMMIDEHLVMPWGAQVRTDVVRDPELLDLMQRSGGDFVALGLESVNQATLDGYEKSQTVTDIEEAVEASCTSTASAATACSCSAPTPTRQTRCATPPASPQEPHRHADAQHPHAAAGHVARSRSSTPQAASWRSAGSSTTRSTWSFSPAHDTSAPTARDTARQPALLQHPPECFGASGLCSLIGATRHLSQDDRERLALVVCAHVAP